MEKTYEAMNKTLQSIIDQVECWAVRNGIAYSIIKQVMCFGSEQVALEIRMKSILLEEVQD